MGLSTDEAREYLASGEYSDIEIVCGEYSFKAHRIILASSSQFFKKTINLPMKENIEKKIRFPEEDSYLVASLITFIYTDSLDLINHGQFSEVTSRYNTIATNWGSRIDFVIGMFHLGDKYMVPKLQETVGERLIRYLGDLRDPFVKKPSADDGPNYEDYHCMLIEATEIIYNSTSVNHWRLREPVLLMVLIELGNAPDGQLWCRYGELLYKSQELAVEVAMSNVSEKMFCRHCGRHAYRRIWKCDHGKCEDCASVGCVQQEYERSICFTYGNFDAVQRPEEIVFSTGSTGW